VTAHPLRKEVARLKAQLGAKTKPAAIITDRVAWTQQAARMSLDPWQRDVLKSEARRAILNCARQVGKTQVVSLLAAAVAAQGGFAIVVAPSLRQSGNLFRRMREHLVSGGITLTRETATEIATAGGGGAICLPGDRPSMIRGLSLRHAGGSALICDEAAFVKNELWAAASPMLAAAPEARLLLLSTPSGPQGEFYRIWQEETDFEKVTISASSCPRISASFLEEERRRLGDAIFSQEFECAFITTGASVFDASALAAMFGETVDVDPDVEVVTPSIPLTRRLPAWLD